MKILLTNDDGVHAPGIQALREALSEIGEVIVVAPLEERSTTGHSLTLNRPLQVQAMEPFVYGISGYPADCVLMGVRNLFKDVRFDVVVSGINRGANLGQDTYYSGTVAGAREAALNNIPSIAVSLVLDTYQQGDVVHFATAGQFVKECLKNKAHHSIRADHVLNVNVPNLPLNAVKGVEAGTMGLRKYSDVILDYENPRGEKFFWIGGHYVGVGSGPGTDCALLHEEKIAYTELDIFHKSLGPNRELENIMNGINLKQ